MLNIRESNEINDKLIAGFNFGQGYAVAQLVEALCYKAEFRGFDSQWCQWNFSFT
jgi:hypothetical protein